MSKPVPSVKLNVTFPKGVQTYEIHKSELILGRSGKADVTIDDAGISREHLRIKCEKNIIYISDQNSLNGTFIDGARIQALDFIAVQASTVITFGKCEAKLQIEIGKPVAAAVTPTVENKGSDDFEIISYDNSSNENKKSEKAPPQPGVAVSVPIPASAKKSEPPPIVETEKEDLQASIEIAPTPAAASAAAAMENPASAETAVKKERELNIPKEIQHRPEDKREFNKLIDVSIFPKKEEDFRLSFKNVGLDLPKYKNPGEHAKEIIRDAEYQKHAILKSAEVLRSKTINETRILAKKASEEAHTEFKRLIDQLLDNTRQELKKLRTDTEVLVDEKRIQANEEIQRLWEEHEEQIRADKEKQYESFEKENKIKLDLSIEKARSDMFAERHKIITDAENEVLQKKRTYQVEFENEKSEHLVKIKTYNEELLKLQTSLEENKKNLKEAKTQKEDAELELSKVVSQLKAEKESLVIINNTFKETEESHKVIEKELANYNETKQKAMAEIEKIQNETHKLNLQYSNITEKKQRTEEELARLTDSLKDAKTKARAEVENEYKILKETEAKKFEDFKVNELKELQKIRDAHTDSIKNFSVDLSQEIATKLELLASKSGYGKFDFEKHFELINSVIQIKGAVNTGSESKHAQQLDDWKNRKRKENFSLISRGFVAGLICVFIANFVYKKLNIDPVQQELARIAAENKAAAAENRFVPEKTDKYYDTYVDSTLYTDRFVEVYLDKKNQQEWVNYATKYFLRQWKVEEEKVIEVISNSNALVQNVQESIPTLKKSKLKTDIAKLKETEDESIKNQAQILGSNVKYEAYKKLEKEFFSSKLQGRVPASQ
ncbi:MAG: FHA domain-containing protein [Pseudobdellovibrio sp.]